MTQKRQREKMSIRQALSICNLILSAEIATSRNKQPFWAKECLQAQKEIQKILSEGKEYVCEI